MAPSPRGSLFRGLQAASPTLHYGILGLVVLIAAGLRFYALDASSLWSDEGNTWALIQRSYAAIARDAAADIHPPGYYWLLKAWSTLWGAVGNIDAYAMRAFSALCGVLVVVGVYAVARLLARARHIALLAALIVALNPFQIYYSQEARMYMPLALASVGVWGALLLYTRREATGQARRGPGLAFWACGALGLWLHYSFPIVLFSAGLYYLLHWIYLYRRQQPGHKIAAWRALGSFALLALAIVAPFLLWLPTAIRQILIWPQGDAPVSLGQGLALTLRTLLRGPMPADTFSGALPGESWWLVAAALLPLLGLWACGKTPSGDTGSSPYAPWEWGPAAAVGLWLLTPVAMMFALGLFSEAFLKFLLVTAPAWAIALAWSVRLGTLARGFGRRAVTTGVLGLLVTGGAIWLALATVPHYYTNATARDNYAGVARYVAAHSAYTDNPLVLLNAPGQRDVWNYYDPGLPVLALPAERPPDRAATEAALATAAQEHDRIFALFWATDEADPDAIVESWLDAHAFPGLETWQGNLRFVDYSLPAELVCTSPASPNLFTADSTAPSAKRLTVRLVEQCYDARHAAPGASSLHVQAGGVLLAQLAWDALDIPLDASTGAQPPLAASLQVLDARNQVVAQRDAGLDFNTYDFNKGESDTEDAEDTEDTEDTRLRQNHGIPIPVGTPPGDYRLIVALYNPQTGARLATPDADALTLNTVRMARGLVADNPLIDAQVHVDRRLGPVTLLGYDLHRKDYAHTPATPVAPGDWVQVTLYWQAPATLPGDWPDDLHFELALGESELRAPLAGGDYPTARWQTHEVVRARFDLLYAGGPRRPTLRIDDSSLRLHALP